jgi:hypothetical protein
MFLDVPGCDGVGDALERDCLRQPSEQCVVVMQLHRVNQASLSEGCSHIFDKIELT